MIPHRSKRVYWRVAWALLAGYVLYLLHRLAWHDALTSLASDSVNYLVMALHYSPWQEESEVIRQTWPLQDFPPLFPMLLAVSGAVHNWLYAHALVVALGLAALYLTHGFSLAITEDPVASQLAAVIVAVSPGYLLGLQDILSESLYIVLTILFLVRISRNPSPSRTGLVLLGFLLAGVMLTRTAGFVLLAALLCQAIVIRVVEKGRARSSVTIALIGLAVFGLVMVVAGPEKATHYIGTLREVLAGRDPSGIGSGSSAIAVQARTFLDAWRTFFIIYWLDEFAFNSVVALALLALSGGVLACRLRSNRLDAWYVLGSILLLLIWPHPGQMLRLIFPLMPILVVYMVHAVFLITRSMQRKQLVRLVAGIVTAMLILPAHAFIFGRLGIASEYGLVPVHEFFRRPDAEAALRDLLIQNQMMQDFAMLERSLPGDEKVLYFEPAYTAILARRVAVRVPAPVEANVYRETARASGAGYIFLTAMHPRQTRVGVNGFSGVESLDGWTEKVWCSVSAQLAENVSCLFKIGDSRG
jgi:hypothetical protein